MLRGAAWPGHGDGSAFHHISVNARIDTHGAIRRQMSGRGFDSRCRVVNPHGRMPTEQRNVAWSVVS